MVILSLSVMNLAAVYGFLVTPFRLVGLTIHMSAVLAFLTGCAVGTAGTKAEKAMGGHFNP